MLTDTRRSPYAKMSPVDGTRWTKGFWKDVEDTLFQVTVPHLRAMFDAPDISHVVENFRIAAGEAEGEFDGTVFGDGDFYKWMESAMYAAVRTQDQALLDALDKYIELIEKAQLPDGYLSTKQIIGERTGKAQRMGDINDFEVYNFGHMFTSAALYYRLTGKDRFLNVASRTADYLDHLYEEARRTGEVRTAVCPSHYMGLIELYRATGDPKYLRLAHTAIELRDSVRDGLDDNQDRIPVKEHRKIIGHAVRANYLYAGLADLYMEEGDPEYKAVLDSVWDDLVRHKIYITGGCGALYNGASPYGNFFSHQLIHQAYGYPYQLPNTTAYNETCANVGLVMWAYRMFLADPQPEYFDMIERVMLNTNLASISLDGKRFFYQNALARAKKLEFELVWPLSRTEYITSYCCPPNLARNLAQSSEYAYTMSEDTIYVGLYGSSKTKIALPNGTTCTLVQETHYPFDGHVDFIVSDLTGPGKLAVRIPSWAHGAWLNGDLVDQPCYAEVDLKEGVIDLDLPIEFRLTSANDMVEEDQGLVCVECGPLVYCMESPDADVGTLNQLRIDVFPHLKPRWIRICGREILALTGEMRCKPAAPEDTLYHPLIVGPEEYIPVQWIPYFAWDNRGMGEMKIWFSTGL